MTKGYENLVEEQINNIELSDLLDEVFEQATIKRTDTSLDSCIDVNYGFDENGECIVSLLGGKRFKVKVTEIDYFG